MLMLRRVQAKEKFGLSGSLVDRCRLRLRWESIGFPVGNIRDIALQHLAHHALLLGLKVFKYPLGENINCRHFPTDSFRTKLGPMGLKPLLCFQDSKQLSGRLRTPFGFYNISRRDVIFLKNLLDHKAAKSPSVVNHLSCAFFESLVARNNTVDHERAIKYLGPTLQAPAFETHLDFGIRSK